MRLHWTPEARAQLKAIEAYIAQDSPAAAKRTIARLARRARQAGDFPHSGRRVPEYQREDLRELLERPYRIVYRIKPEQIDIVTVWHYRRLLPAAPPIPTP
jgi:plasmid stabilization system protein ParE